MNAKGTGKWWIHGRRNKKEGTRYLNYTFPMLCQIFIENWRIALRNIIPICDCLQAKLTNNSHTVSAEFHIAHSGTVILGSDLFAILHKASGKWAYYYRLAVSCNTNFSLSCYQWCNKNSTWMCKGFFFHIVKCWLDVPPVQQKLQQVTSPKDAWEKLSNNKVRPILLLITFVL